MKHVEVAAAKVSVAHESGLIVNARSRNSKFIHRIWLTNSSQPCEPPRKYVDDIITRSRLSYQSDDWLTYLWVQDRKLLPSTTSALEATDGLVCVKEISEGLTAGAWQVNFDKLIQDRKFPFAADILRVKILFEYGGIYADMGVHFATPQLLDLITNNFDYAFVFWENMFYQNSLIMTPVGSSICAAFLKVVEDPYLLPRSLLSPLSGMVEGHAFSGLLLTALLYSMAMEDGVLCPLVANKRVVSWSSQQSWYTNTGNHEGKFGNVFVPESSPSILRADGWTILKPSIFDIAKDLPLSAPRSC